MRAMLLRQPRPIDEQPLELVDLQRPHPGPGEILIRVNACGVCHTDLHIAEGELPPHRSPVVPGHQIVGRVTELGEGVTEHQVGARVGVPWLNWADGTCRFCRRGDENLCDAARFTGWDVDGGYAEYLVAHEDYVYAVPEQFDDVHAAPLLCAGIIGYRALRRANCPPGGRLGIYGFGGSAHLAAQVAMAEGMRVHVCTRAADARALALELGAASAQGADDPPPEPLDAAVLFAPVGTLVPPALEALDRGGTLAIAGIHLSDVPPLNYQQHLFQERSLRSVTANTRADGREFLAAAAHIPIHVETTPYPFAQANQALRDLAHDRVKGAAVLVLDV